jgi:peptide/nickel transport system permease protein
MTQILHTPRRRPLNMRRRALAVFVATTALLVAVVSWGWSLGGLGNMPSGGAAADAPAPAAASAAAPEAPAASAAAPEAPATSAAAPHATSAAPATSAATATDFSAKNLAPSAAHPFGTDWMGRDMLARTLAGLSTSALIGLFAAFLSALIALALGAAAALGGRRLDAAVTWLIDLVLGIPHIVLLMLISYALGKGFWGVAIGVAVTHWTSLARVIRAEILQYRQSVHVAIARKLGASPLRIALTHMLPALMPQFIVGLVLLFPHAILHEAAISFLGFGLNPEQPAIGIILSEAMGYLSVGSWWLALFPGLALVATVLLFDRAGSSLRGLLDPHRSQE